MVNRGRAGSNISIGHIFAKHEPNSAFIFISFIFGQHTCLFLQASLPVIDFTSYPPDSLLSNSETMAGSDKSELYKYAPSLAAAATFTILFLITTLLHTYQLLRTRVWYFIPVFLGGLCETIGFIGRVLGARETFPDYTLGPYIIQSLLLLVAPVLFAASIYMELGHIIQLTGQVHLSPIKLRFLTAIFVLGDFFAFMVQSTGASILTKKEKDSAVTGKWIIIGGLAIQLMSFGFFMAVSAIFHSRCNQNPTKRSESPRVPWRKHMWALYLASALVVVRSVFRLVEYIMGSDGYLMKHEVWLYVFDAVLMFGVMVGFNVVHPSEVKGLLRGRKAMRWLVLTREMEKVDEAEAIDGALKEVHQAYRPNVGGIV